MKAALATFAIYLNFGKSLRSNSNIISKPDIKRNLQSKIGKLTQDDLIQIPVPENTTSSSNSISIYQKKKCTKEETPPADSNCWNWNNIDENDMVKVFYSSNEYQKGCDHEICSNTVCDCDPYCCEMSWDLSCRGFQVDSLSTVDNFFNNGCSASLLCCEPDDAQPKPPTPTNPNPLRSKKNSDNVTVSSNIKSKCEQEGWETASDSTCWRWNVLFDKAYLFDESTDAQRGCDDPKCQEAVCACDPYCCDVSWDLSCRGFQTTRVDDVDNPFVKGCSASLLCCEPDDAFPKPPLPPS